jgi:hypothetical protein
MQCTDRIAAPRLTLRSVNNKFGIHEPTIGNCVLNIKGEWKIKKKGSNA